MPIKSILPLLFRFNPSNRAMCRLDIDEALALHEYAKNAALNTEHQARAVEIGRFAGGSTILLHDGLLEGHIERHRRRGEAVLSDRTRDPDSLPALPLPYLLSIDKAPKDDDLLSKIIAPGDVEMDLVVNDSRTYSPPQLGPLDLVFVDGGHDYDTAKLDHMRWGVKLRAGGYIIHHDMGMARPNATQIQDLKRLRDDILTHQTSCVELVAEVGSLAVFRRRGTCWRSWS